MTPELLCLGTCAFGRAIDSRGVPLDDGPPLEGALRPVELRAPRPNERVAIEVPLWTGVRVVDAMLTIGRGARVGIFGAPGCGKTTLLEAFVECSAVDAVVVALVGERGREAERWIRSRDGRATFVCATSDRPAEERVAAAHVAFAQARVLRDCGLHVLLVLDSFARFALALREITVARGESAGRGGYPPGVFAEMARLVEVAGAVASGSITLIATVLTDGDDRDPVSEAARSLLDGHIALSLALAHAGHFPAVDVLQSASRTMEAIVTETHRNCAQRLREVLATLERIKDARALGFEPAEKAARAAIAIEPQLERFLAQGPERTGAGAMLAQLASLERLWESERGNR